MRQPKSAHEKRRFRLSLNKLARETFSLYTHLHARDLHFLQILIVSVLEKSDAIVKQDRRPQFHDKVY